MDKLLIYKKYENLETIEIENKLSFLNNKIEILKKDVLRKTKEMEECCIESIEIIELLNERQNKGV